MASSEGIGSLVASHYNKLEERGREVRQESRIFFMRNFNNWAKSVLISDATKRLDSDRPITVFDLGCGKGGDLQKWDKARVGKLVCSDIAETSLDQCKERYSSRRRDYSAEFVHADATKDKIQNLLKNRDMEFDLVSSQFVLHYSFESMKQANQFLENVSSNLRPGGYFIGTTTDSNEIMRRLTAVNATNQEQDSSQNAESSQEYKIRKFGNAIYSVEFDKDVPLNPPKLFGTQYKFHLEEVVDCPEFLVHFGTLERLAAKHHLKLIMKSSFEEYITRNIPRHRDLLSVINCLEVYPNQKLVGNPETDYNHVKDKGTQGETVGTLSKDEWEAMTLYCVFIFQKEYPGANPTADVTHRE